MNLLSLRSRFKQTATCGAFVCFVFGLSACGLRTQNSAVAIDKVPFDLVATTTSSTTSSTTPSPTSVNAPIETVSLYFIAANKVIPTLRDLPIEPTLQQVLDELVKGLPQASFVSLLRSALPEKLRATVEVTRGLAVVDTDESLLAVSASIDQRLAIAQIVLTLTSRPGVGQVLFTVDGLPQAVPRGAGDLAKANQPVAYEDYVSLLEENRQPN
jgi:spore germination protein GerM